MKKTLRIIALLLVIVMTAVLFNGCDKTGNVGRDGKELQIGDPAPDFTAKMADGGTYTLSESKDKVVILNFWATWCDPCCVELPAFQRLYDEYGDKLQVLTVNCVESKEDVVNFIEENGYTFPFALDEDASINALYPSDGIPYTLVIDKNGIISQTFIGAKSAEAQYSIYKTAIEKVLNE